ncbi:protein YLS3-like [Forsythia ovata]|uniref:Protein YLS3-like n=1 Tax=Forsythia ovata TaxID=205694 RepID=A0ABD1WZ69_9LAMI
MDRKKNLFTIICILVGTMAMVAMATMEDDEKDCAEQLTNLASCIPFVSGTAKKPTPECCQDTDKVRTAKPKCLCVLIKESTDPSMGLPINTTLALQMPSVCNIEAKISDCPSILKLPADSPDAKIFQVAGDSSTSNSPPASASTSSSSSTGSSSDSKTSASTSDGAKITGKVPKAKLPHLCHRPLDQAGCKSRDVHEWQEPEEKSQQANPQDRPPQYFSENLPYTEIEPALLENFSPRHLKPYQLAYAPVADKPFTL